MKTIIAIIMACMNIISNNNNNGVIMTIIIIDKTIIIIMNVIMCGENESETNKWKYGINNV